MQILIPSSAFSFSRLQEVIRLTPMSRILGVSKPISNWGNCEKLRKITMPGLRNAALMCRLFWMIGGGGSLVIVSAGTWVEKHCLELKNVIAAR
jgi:hypothetical protein